MATATASPMPPKYDAITETSVTFSLAELAKIEGERVREEELRRRDEEATAAREAARVVSERRAAETARAAAEDEARDASRRQELEIRIREAAREKAAAEVARIEAEAKARLDADNAARAHELAQIRARAESSRGGRTTILTVALGLAIAGGVGVAMHGASASGALRREAADARADADACVSELSRAKAEELSTLARTHAASLAASRLGALDKRREDLAAWAGDRRATEALSIVSRASTRAHVAVPSDDGAVRAYDLALDQLRGELGREPVSAAGRSVGPRAKSSTGAPDPRCVKNPDDPGCGLDGRPIF